MEPETLEILTLVTASKKLDRDRGLERLSSHLPTVSSDELAHLETYFLELETLSANVGTTEDRIGVGWERDLGLLSGAASLLESGRCDVAFAERLTEPAMAFLKSPEVRVREAASALLGVIAAKRGIDLYNDVEARLIDMIRNNLERKSLASTEAELVDKLADQPFDKGPVTADQIFHDTAGWKNLETSMKSLEHIVFNLGAAFKDCVDNQLLDLVTKSLFHTNRFVRESVLNLLGALVTCTDVDKHGDVLADHISLGLSDNWSQVRLAASVAARRFFDGLDVSRRATFYPKLLPYICLNRYYVAEGVRLYNQDTWRTVIGEAEDSGLNIVTSNMERFVDVYVAQSKAENHAVREAACACIAELGNKIPTEFLGEHVGVLLEALEACFRDESWPVRDAACVACGHFVKSYPEQTSSSLETLLPLFFVNLFDNISSVRRGAASAIANVVETHPDQTLTACLDKIKEGWTGIADQKAKENDAGSYVTMPGAFGVVKRIHEDETNDQSHTNQVMYSCGSLAPKMGRGTQAGGCSNHTFTRPSELWEIGDGCVHLAAELSTIPRAAEKIPELFPLLVDGLKNQDYQQHEILHETFCRRLPDLARGLGKTVFKRHLETFFPALFYALNSDTALTREAAVWACGELASFLGPGIFRGRVERYDPALLNLLPPLPSTIDR